jgi:hypothetical protein
MIPHGRAGRLATQVPVLALPVLGLWALGCASAPAPWRGAAPPEWPAFQAELAALRASHPRAPWAAGLRATLRSPRTGRTIDARGGIAVAPGRAIRLVLVAGAGATALDAWVTPDRWRIAVPPAGLVRRGGADDPAELPVGFLRWWFFTPLEGSLFAARREASPTGPEDVLLLRNGAAVIELRPGPCLRARRRLPPRTERVEECGGGASPQPGDRVRYDDDTSGLTVDIVVESRAVAPPTEDAFVDPDTAGEP